MAPEFDQYAPEYTRLLQDPIRDRFAGNSMFFHIRKWFLIKGFLRAQKMNAATLSWLDVGCGQGELLQLAGSNFARAVGCDPSSGMIRSGASKQIYEQPSPAELPFADQSFDFVTAVCVYHHVHGTEKMIVRRCPVDSEAELLTARDAVRLMRSVDLEFLDTVYFLYFPEKVFSYIGRVESALRKIPAGGQFAVFGRKPRGLADVAVG